MRGRKPIPIYIYKNQELWCKAASIAEAAEITSVTPPQVRNILYHLGKQTCTRQGFSYYTKPLTAHEIEQLPCIETEQKGYKSIDGTSRTKIVAAQEYEVACNDGKVTYKAYNTPERRNNCKQLLLTRLR